MFRERWWWASVRAARPWEIRSLRIEASKDLWAVDKQESEPAQDLVTVSRKQAIPGNKYFFSSPSSSVVHVPGVNDIQSSSSTGQNISQISRQLNQGQVAWTGSRPPFPGQV